jgi:hypothetical protein
LTDTGACKLEQCIATAQDFELASSLNLLTDIQLFW